MCILVILFGHGPDLSSVHGRQITIHMRRQVQSLNGTTGAGTSIGAGTYILGRPSLDIRSLYHTEAARWLRALKVVEAERGRWEWLHTVLETADMPSLFRKAAIWCLEANITTLEALVQRKHELFDQAFYTALLSVTRERIEAALDSAAPRPVFPSMMRKQPSLQSHITSTSTSSVSAQLDEIGDGVEEVTSTSLAQLDQCDLVVSLATERSEDLEDGSSMYAQTLSSGMTRVSRAMSEQGALVLPGGMRRSAARLSAAPKVLDTVDTTGDGLLDSVVLDVTGDGLADATRKIEWRVSPKRRVQMINSVADTQHTQELLARGDAAIDTTGDGQVDSLVFDTAGDGFADTLQPLQSMTALRTRPMEHTTAQSRAKSRAGLGRSLQSGMPPPSAASPERVSRTQHQVSGRV